MDAWRICNCLERFRRDASSRKTVPEIDNAVQGLSRNDLTRFREWFQEFDAAVWDEQFEEDVIAGRLDALAEEALRDLHDGRCSDSDDGG